MDVVKPIGDSWRFCKSHRSIFYPGIVSALMTLIILASYGFPVTNFNPQNINTFLIIAVTIISLVVSSFTALWTVSIVNSGGKKSASQAASEALSRLPSAIGGSILLSLILVAGFVALIIPGIYLMVRLIFFYQSIIIDKNGAIPSLKQSWNLIKGKWWDTFGFLILLTLASFVFLIPYYGLFFMSLISASFIFGILSFIYMAAISIFLTPFIYGAFTFYYLEIRKERKK